MIEVGGIYFVNGRYAKVFAIRDWLVNFDIIPPTRIPEIDEGLNFQKFLSADDQIWWSVNHNMFSCSCIYFERFDRVTDNRLLNMLNLMLL